jgi:hypothetical protein
MAETLSLLSPSPHILPVLPMLGQFVDIVKQEGESPNGRGTLCFESAPALHLPHSPSGLCYGCS